MKFDPNTVHSRVSSPLGVLILAATPRGLSGVWFDDQQYLPPWAAWPTATDHPVLLATTAWLSAYFEGSRRPFAQPLDLSAGTAFQQSVWQALLKIPLGQCSTYGQISQDIGNPKAVRAVGGAIGHNPIGIIVPCHRVIGKDGTLTGYAGGLARKTALLDLELGTKGLF
jgi:methylated-DNA-[protein]-cysteine S-methyltransferase